MVKGNPLKLMLQFALPLLIGNLLQQTYNIIDAAIVGQILAWFLYGELYGLWSTGGQVFRSR